MVSHLTRHECLLCCVCCVCDGHFNTKEAEKLNKYNDLEIEVSMTWKLRIKIVPFMTGILGKIKKVLHQNLQLLPGHRSVIELRRSY